MKKKKSLNYYKYKTIINFKFKKKNHSYNRKKEISKIINNTYMSVKKNLIVYKFL